jgi:hypothetical protein
VAGNYIFANKRSGTLYVISNGAVRFPVDFQLYRRYEEVTQWSSSLAQQFPELKIPATAAARQQLHRQFDKQLLAIPAFAQLQAEFKSKITLAKLLLESAIKQGVEFTTVLMDSWYLNLEIVEALAALGKDWVSLLKHNRKLQVQSLRLKDEQGQPIRLAGEQG